MLTTLMILLAFTSALALALVMLKTRNEKPVPRLIPIRIVADQRPYRRRR